MLVVVKSNHQLYTTQKNKHESCNAMQLGHDVIGKSILYTGVNYSHCNNSSSWTLLASIPFYYT